MPMTFSLYIIIAEWLTMDFFQVNIVDPLKLTQEFGSILADPIIATNVSAKFHVHARL